MIKHINKELEKKVVELSQEDDDESIIESTNSSAKSNNNNDIREKTNKENKWRTKLCKFYPRNMCRKGEDCPFIHDQSVRVLIWITAL